MARFLDRNHPMFARAWVRWATVLVPAVWTVVEIWSNSPGWAVLFGAATVYAAWELFIRR